MKEIIEILENLRKLSGNSAIDYLKSHSDNMLLKEVLQMTYNPDKKYGINEAKFDKARKKITSEIDTKTFEKDELDKTIWERYKNSLESIASKKGVQESDVEGLFSSYFLLLDEKGYALLKGVLFKDLRIGMDVKTFNKVWNDFCFKYPYLGARSFKMENLEKLKMPCYAQLKADGLFCNMIVDPINKTVEYVSRQGKPINIKGSLDESLLKITASEKFVLTGEILVWDNTTNRPKPREISNGIIRRDNKTQEELDSIRTMIWDCVPYKNFVEAKWNVPYSKRLELLKKMIAMSDDRLILIETHIVNSVKETLNLFNELYSRGEEGLVVKEMDLLWEDKKPKGCVKVKNESEADLLCYGFDEGTGNFIGTLGAIKCKSGDGLLIVDIGTGLTEEDRKEIWQNQDKYLNKILTVKYNAKIKRQDSEIYSLFLPVFVEWRDLDKTNADKLEDIK